MAVGETRQGVGERCMWVDAVQFGGFDKRGGDRPVVSAVVEACEKRVLLLSMGGRMLRSTMLETSSTRPSSRKQQSPPQWLDA